MREPILIEVSPGELIARILSAINETLWQVEDQLRQCEADEDFGPRFIHLARSVYRHNDHQHAIKQKIDSLAKARVFEEKSYSTY